MTSKDCSTTCYSCRYWREFTTDLLFGWTMFLTHMRSLVYVPSSRSCSSFFIVHVSAPCSRMLSTQALKKETLVEVEMLDCQTVRSLLQAFQARPFLARKSFLMSATYDPRYLKSSTSLMCAPSIEVILGWVGSSFIRMQIMHADR